MPTPSANVTPLTGDMLTVFDQTIGCKGALIVPTLIDMTSATILSGEIDFSTLINQQVLDFVSGFYIDNRDGAENITLVCATTQMRYVVAAGSQTFGQLLLSNPPKITWSTAAQNGVIVPAYFGNIPFIPFANNLSQSVAPSGPTLVDLSIAALTGASETLAAAGAATHYLMIQNPTGNGDVTINLAGGDAATSGIVITAGQYYESLSGVANAVTIDGTLGDTVIAFGG